jgi:hypothetical protein
VVPRAPIGETISETAYESIQFWQQVRQALSIHAESSRSQRVIASLVDSAKAA